jgi:uncharacterized protein (DUF488 family)
VATEILTIGHSTHELPRFLGLLAAHRVRALADVRRYPASRRNPQFNSDALAGALAAVDIGYESLAEELGGRRRPRPGRRNSGWRVEAFRGYADHMGQPTFAAGLKRVERTGSAARTAVLCAEEDWRRCHRRLIADALVVGGWQVLHVRGDGSVEQHALTPFALASETGITYPPPQTTLTD